MYLYQGELRVDNSALNGEAEECRKVAVSDFKAYKELAMTADVTGILLLMHIHYLEVLLYLMAKG